ncbi:MAG: YbhB/YbcL family Raf kinase inhibitor-like protein [Actinomycetota bacterium]
MRRAPADATTVQNTAASASPHGSLSATSASRRASWSATAMMAGVGVFALVAMAACDTDDGTTLSTPDPALITTAPPTTLDPTASTAEQMLPGDDAAEDGAFELIGPWVDGAPIDSLYTCDGDDVSPAISWVGVPEGTQELAFVMVDDTTGEGGGQPFIHWVVAGIDPAEITLIEDETPVGGIVGLNFFGNVAYNGPCPPPDDEPHDYRIVGYALNQQTELADGTPATEFIDFLDDVAIETTDLTGTYGR